MSTPFIRSLVEIVGSPHCLGGAERAPYVIDGRTPCGVVFPGSAEEVARVVRAAAAAGVPVVPWGGGTEMHRGAPPADGALVVGLRRLDRVLEHEPGDLTATAEAGISMAALQRALGRGENDASTLNGLAWTCATNGVYLNEALQAAERAASLEPKNAGILDTLAEVHFRMGNAEKAVEVGSRALAIEPDNTYLADQLRRFQSASR